MGGRVKKKAEQPHANWLNTYADMVTLLLCFFVMLFAMSEVDRARFEVFAQAIGGRTILPGGVAGTLPLEDTTGVMPEHAVPGHPVEPTDYEIAEIGEMIAARIYEMEGMADSFRTYMAPYALAYEIGITVDPLGEFLRITFPSGMLFQSGQAVLTPQAVDIIDYVAVHLALFPGHRISIQGHTDNAPISTVAFPSNFHLSAARAISVMNRLVQYHGFSYADLEATGMGEHRPVDTNNTPEGMANNRRVEILVFAQQQELSY